MDIVPDIEVTKNASLLWAWALEFLPKLAAALAIVVLGWLLARWAGRTISRLIDRTNRVDSTFAPVAGSVIRYAQLCMALVAALGQLGVQTTSLLAALGAIALAIGLALQGTLANIAAGLMILWLRPFRVGEAIETPSVAGTVEQVHLFHTQVRTWDGVFKFVPNSQLWNVTLTNYSRNPTRLVALSFPVAYEEDLARARDVLLEAADTHPKVQMEPAPEVVPLAIGDGAVTLQMRAWVAGADFGTVSWDLTHAGKKALDKAGISVPSPHRLVRLVTEPAPRQERPADE
jgi:small conductance mechanosensitive channel